MDSSVLTVDSDGPVRIITLNRPEHLNAITKDLHDRLADVWRDVGRDVEARAVVITGAGRAFSAGGDVPGFLKSVASADVRRSSIREASRLVFEMLHFHLPVIAAVNGPAVGLGASVAVMSDIVYMAETAFMSDPHVPMGLVAGDGGAVTWPLMTSLLKAKEYLFTGDRISADEALRLGLANKVWPSDELMPQALAFAHRLAGLPTQALQDTKRALNIHLRTAAQNVVPFALASEELSFSTDDVAMTAKKFSERAK